MHGLGRIHHPLTVRSVAIMKAACPALDCWAIRPARLCYTLLHLPVAQQLVLVHVAMPHTHQFQVHGSGSDTKPGYSLLVLARPTSAFPCNLMRLLQKLASAKKMSVAFSRPGKQGSTGEAGGADAEAGAQAASSLGSGPHRPWGGQGSAAAARRANHPLWRA